MTPQVTSNSNEPIPIYDAALSVHDVTYSYGKIKALDKLDFQLAKGSIVGILGPNGSGKSTLFKLISTLIPMQGGDIYIFGLSVRKQVMEVRRSIGIVFQSPSLDRKLTVAENIRCQAALVGLAGKSAVDRTSEVMAQLNITDRAKMRVEKLSGGLKRRVELAKGILHRPPLLLLDEPSTGLDPAARLDFWEALNELRDQFNTTIVLTTHLLEEAEKCDQLAILHKGKCVALDVPEKLRREAGDSILTLVCNHPADVAFKLREQFDWSSVTQGNQVRISAPNLMEHLDAVTKLFKGKVDSMTIARPSLEDVFVAKTGDRLFQ